MQQTNRIKNKELLGRRLFICEICRKLKFEYAVKCCTNKTEYIRENEMPSFLWDFEIQIDHQIQARRPNYFINKHVNLLSGELSRFSRP